MPYTYDGEEPIVAFGDNVLYLADKDFKQGVFTDIVGAKLLKEKGVDVGFNEIQDVKQVTEFGEEYPKYGDIDEVNFVNTYKKRTVEIYRLELNGKAEVLSRVSGKEAFPITYRYENEKGKLLVCCLDMMQSRFGYGLFNSYYKQKILIECYEWMKGEPLAAVCLKCPKLMPIIGKKENKLVIGLWNIFEDEIFNQPILLGEEYSKATCIGCAGELQGKIFTLDKLSAFEYCVIVLEK